MDAAAFRSSSIAGPTHGSSDADSSGDDDNDGPDDGMYASAGFRPRVRRAGTSRGFKGGLGGFISLLRHIAGIGYRKTRLRGSDGNRASLVEGLMSGERREDRGPSLLAPLREILMSSWLNSLVIFVPIGLGTYLAHMAPILVFTSNALAVIPLSSLLTAATEQVANDAGDVVGALLNISLGNLVELILFVALMNNQIRVVQASILGSILVNSLLILGTALLATSVSSAEPVYNTAETQLLGCLLFVSVFVFMMPTAFDFTFDHHHGTDKSTLRMTRISALLVLLIYTIYFVHELKSRPLRSDEESRRRATLTAEPNLLVQSPVVPPPRTIRFADEGHMVSKPPNPIIELGDMDSFAAKIDDSGNGPGGSDSDDDNGLGSRGRTSQDVGPSSRRPGLHHRSHGHSRSLSHGSSHDHFGRSRASSAAGRHGLMRSGLTTLHLLREGRASLDSILAGPPLQSPAPAPRRSTCDKLISVLVLIVTSALMSMNAEFLVSTIDEVTHAGHLSEALIGLIILPVVGNISEYVTVVTVAAKDKLDLAIAVAVGSSIQIALCVAPLTVLAGWILKRPLALTFNFFEMASLVGSALLVSLLVLNDGGSTFRTSGLKGSLMCACYVIIALGAYLSPSE